MNGEPHAAAHAPLLRLPPGTTHAVHLLDADADAWRPLLAACADVQVVDASVPAHIALGPPDRVAAALRAGQRYRWVQSTWAGITPLLAEDLPRDYLLTGIGGIFGPWMAEYVVGHLLQLDLRIDEHRAAQQRGEWRPRLPRRLVRRRIAVLGTGDIGSAIARALSAFGCTVTGINRGGVAADGFARTAAVADLLATLAQHDTLVSTLPDTPVSRGLLDATALAALPRGAVFINVGRGSVVDEAALVEALRSGHLARAVLDVTQHEPLPAGHPFWTSPNVRLTFHTAGPSRPEEIAPIFIDNLRRISAGEPPHRVVDFARGY